jgi:DNA helicase-2/ATP-dependent DNA helicase PcrA
MMTNSNPSPVELTDEQRAIVETDEDTIVVSNPGTGKTTTLSAKVVKLLEDGVKPEEILCITFTTKAKKEMFDAIRLRSAKKFSVSDIMKINIHTFHSFAFDYLTDSGFISGDIIGNNILRFSILESFEANQALNYTKSYIVGKLVPKVENAIRYIKSYGITPDQIDLKEAQKQVVIAALATKTKYSLEELEAFTKYFIDAYQAYENSKTDEVDFSDMLLRFIAEHRGEKFQHVLVDEMQDMNEIEAQIVNKIHENLFLVGDAKQAIFGFQGGAIKNFEEFAKKCKLMLLATNLRSTQEILDYSKKYFLAGTSYRPKFEKELKNFKSSKNGPVPKIFQTNAPLSMVRRLLEENKGMKIGIVTRTNYQLVEVSKYLDFNNIPYVSTASQATSLNARNELISYIKGLISNRLEEKITAAFTTFSPFTLKETFELSAAYKNKDKQKLEKIENWEIDLVREDLDKLFTEKIYPLCASKGAEWFTTAMLVNKQINEYLTFQTPTLEGLFDFIAIGEEEYDDRNKESEIILTTVHKAKGRGFDIVIYIPSVNDPKTSFIDTVTTGIFASQGIVLGDEVAEESLRVDFVAFTRAKKKLFIIGDEKSAQFFHVQDLSEFEVDPTAKDQQIITVVNKRLTDAYSLFVSGNLTEAEKHLKDKEPWLKEYIFSYFENIDHFSYSSTKTNSYKFLMQNIVKLPFISGPTDFGSDVHNALEKILLKQAKPEDFSGDIRRAIDNGLSALEELEKKFPGLQLVEKGTEVKVDVSLNSIVQYEPDDLIFTVKIDALFKHDSGYLMVDWKTDRDDGRSSEHKRQLSVYKKVYSKGENIPEDEITTCVIFIALRERINTGKFERSIDIGTRNPFPTFEKHLQKILGWRKDPNTFIEDLLDPLLHKETDELFLAIKEELTTHLGGDPRWKQNKDGVWVQSAVE